MRSRLPQFELDMNEASHAGEARRLAVDCAGSAGLGETERGAIAIVATEMASNVVKHAQHGRLICDVLETNGSRGLRLVSMDKGPGIPNVSTALEDGYSTAGTAGNGLGAIRRLATRFDIYSARDRGTCVVAEFWPDKKIPRSPIPLRLATISVAFHGEKVCGDGWAIKPIPDGALIMVVDGLGHGSYAAEAAQEAERVLAETNSVSPAAILHDCHHALKKTRGAAAGIVAISEAKGTLTFAGLGNVSAILLTACGRRGLTSHNGTLGHQMHRLQEFTFPWEQSSTLVMHSDGLGSKWDLNDYPGLTNRQPCVLASVLYRDFERTRDDVTVLVAKNPE